MKKIIKKLKLVSYICLAVFLLNSCTQEKEYINEHNQPKIKFEEKSFKEALNLSLFNVALKKVSKQKGALRSEDVARTALEDQYGFTIVTDAPIRIITDENGIVSYTILIEREVKEELIFENLMIKVEDEETTAAIFKYTMTEKGTITDDNNYVFSEYSSSQFTDLNIEGKMFFNSDGETCFSTNVIRCNNTSAGEPAGHLAHSGCWAAFTNNPFGGSIYNSTETTCISGSGIGMTGGTGGGTGGGGGGGGTGGSSNNTGGLGGSGGNNQPIDVTPIPCRTGNCIEADVPVEPCVRLKERFQADKGNIDSLVVELRGNLGIAGESGKSLRKTTNGVYGSTNCAITADLKITVTTCLDYYGSMHTHPYPGAVSMFSWEDVYSLVKFYECCSFSNTEEITIYLFTKDASGNFQTYALIIDNIDTLADAMVADVQRIIPNMTLEANTRNVIDALDEEMTFGYSNSTNKELYFLKRFQNFGISLYKADTALTSWEKLTVTNPTLSTAAVLPIPCPN